MANKRDSAEIEIIDMNAAAKETSGAAIDEDNGVETPEQSSMDATDPDNLPPNANEDTNTKSSKADQEAESDSDIDQLQAQLSSVKESIETYKDQLLRSQAEQQNIRRRMQRDVENARKYALEKFSEDLFPIVDSLEHALKAMDEDKDTYKAVRDGVELSLKMFIDTLAKHNISQVDPEGEPFDPKFHEAMSMIPNADVEPNTVIAVMQKGYTLHERLVRPARVIVAKAVTENTNS